MLVAGYSKNLARLGLRTYLPDFNDLSSRGGREAPADKRSSPSASKPSQN